MGQMRMFRQQQGNCAAKIQALKQTQKRVELTNKEISSVRCDFSLMNLTFEIIARSRNLSLRLGRSLLHFQVAKGHR